MTLASLLDPICIGYKSKICHLKQKHYPKKIPAGQLLAMHSQSPVMLPEWNIMPTKIQKHTEKAVHKKNYKKLSGKNGHLTSLTKSDYHYKNLPPHPKKKQPRRVRN